SALGHPLTPSNLATGVAFEFLHLASLLHDDIVDLAEIRRGRAAAHLTFGVPETVLAGDYLLSKAAALGADTDNIDCVKIMARVVRSLALGELMQLSARRRVNLSEIEYFRIIYRKTAALMEGAAQSATILAGAGERLAAGARCYGRQLGLAFQIVDDILDYQSDQQTFGKPVGHDLDEGKITLPFIRARDSLNPARRARLCALAGEDKISHQNHEEIAALVAEGNGTNLARRTATELTQKARIALNLFPPSIARKQLTDLTLHTVNRSN
ncbi:MAG: hypothetical protein AMR96_03930, partial [Candidatus Adiutrix intracellularis]